MALVRMSHGSRLAHKPAVQMVRFNEVLPQHDTRRGVGNAATRLGSSIGAQSAFADYKPYQEIPAGDWRVLNDKVRDAGGGSMAHDMAMPPSAAASAQGSTAPKTAPKAPMKGHMGHQMPGGMR